MSRVTNYNVSRKSLYDWQRCVGWFIILSRSTILVLFDFANDMQVWQLLRPNKYYCSWVSLRFYKYTEDSSAMRAVYTKISVDLRTYLQNWRNLFHGK